MNTALFLLISLTILYLGYKIYGTFIYRRFGADSYNKTPAHLIDDKKDFVPTQKIVLFGHHYASIAAAGPIVGPTLAILYGLVPVWLWIIMGVILIGAVHDFATLFTTMREQGKSLAIVAYQTMGKPGYVLNLVFSITLCILVAAAFLHLAALSLTSMYPVEGLQLSPEQTLIQVSEVNGVKMGSLGGIASTSVIIITLFSPFIGYLLYKKNLQVSKAVILSFFVCCVSVIVGFFFPVRIDITFWMWAILLYSCAASFVPVWILLQPRDFINVQLLYIGLLVMIVSGFVAGINGTIINAPLFSSSETWVDTLGYLWPFLFVTVACGACSGAHGLICGGTTCKQIDNEKDTHFIGYGAMCLEAVLAVCVLTVVLGGLGYDEYLQLVWPVDGKGNPPLAFALGLGKTMEKAFSIPISVGTVFGILLLEGFVVTTIDTLFRLSRYLLEEFWEVILKTPPAVLKNPFVNSAIITFLAGLLAYTNGYKTIWPVFGAANQLLAGLSLLTISFWLQIHEKKNWFTLIPAILIMITTITALSLLCVKYYQSHNIPLLIADVILLVLGIGVGVLFIRKTLAFKKPSLVESLN